MVRKVKTTVFPITPDESTVLITMSTSSQPVELSFGSGLALFNTPDNEWAVKAVQAIRRQNLAC